MLYLEPEEKVLLILHHHWIELLGPFVIALILFLVPPFLLPLAASQGFLPLYLFLICLWYLIVLFIVLAFWIKYYLDALVITDKRVLDVGQEGLFRHVVSEFRIEQVQDVTIDVPNFFATVLHYGNITIQTAGEMSFSIKNVPTPHLARDLILNRAKGGAKI